jgi:uroporphyrinogen III methyltransferase / synthase
VLAETLRAAGAIVGQAVAYESRDVAEPTPEVAALLESGGVDWITVTSSAIARSLVAMFGKRLQRTKLVAISPLTAGVLAGAGYPPAATAATYTADGLVAAIQASAK